MSVISCREVKTVNLCQKLTVTSYSVKKALNVHLKVQLQLVVR